MPAIRSGEAGDLPEIATIQAASPEAAHWKVEEYLRQDLRVAVCADGVAGFLVSRVTAPGEWEVLNLAVAPDHRRQGVGGALLGSLLKGLTGVVYLEVRESNQTARRFYYSKCFQEVGVRPGYYESPPEAAIVMKFHSC